MMGTGLISGHQDSRVRQNFTGGGVGWGRGVNFRTRGEKDHTDHERRRGAKCSLCSKHCAKGFRYRTSSLTQGGSKSDPGFIDEEVEAQREEGVASRAVGLTACPESANNRAEIP